ncbi:Hypothetical protein LUCI_0137 [Lucifera butyrica]|uniref:DUF4432 family protein n=1 Tax=Lucifera butyrica TaxID=1351585 RepID=A0A498R0U0_9FIRM|nr:aldose 1-epimerase family protein [Lucifera butyrica]VBB04931.1 Hypothetical protein LUCI_0137 [Lucifera butyrica]
MADYLHSYLGHDSQLFGFEEHRLCGGRGDGMRLLQAKNGKGLEFTISLDRCADISRMSFKGNNLGYFAPCGYVGPQYYDDNKAGFLKSFTAGFLTTCGLTAVGSPCVDEGEELPLHGEISNIPSEEAYYYIDRENQIPELVLRATIRQAKIFAEKLELRREIRCSTAVNEIKITDIVKNNGCKPSPLMILYHFNIGYPLLAEQARLFIPSDSVLPRNEHAEKDIAIWNQVLPPQADFEEQCYYHSFAKNSNKAFAAIYNPNIKAGLAIDFDTQELDCFTQWKMMGIRDYVMGLEPGNCLPDGRDVMRKKGQLKFIRPGEEVTYHVNLRIIENEYKYKGGK